MGDSDKQGISLAVVGTHGCGKTTALAELCNQLDVFAAEPHQECRELAKELGRPSQQHAWMLDKLLTERERGLTVKSSLQKFQSGSFVYSAMDTPGKTDFVKNMLSVTSMADVAVLVVSAAAGEWEAGVESGRTRELALCCFTMGIKHIIVWVTKMDDQSVLYSSSRFEDIKKVVSNFVKEVGYKQKDVPVVPISGLCGDNLVSKSAEMSWYTGEPVLQTLDAIGPINRPAEKPLRLPVLKVHNIPGTDPVIVGRVETGQIRSGIKVIFSPGGQIADVRSIQIGGKDVNEAKGGDIVGFTLGAGISSGDIQRGMVASSNSNDPAAAAETFIAQVVVLDHPGEIRAGYCPSIAVHTAQVACEFEELLAKIDRKTSKESEVNPECVKTGDVVSVKLRPRSQITVEPFSAYPSLGRFAVRDHNRTIAVGVIKEVTKKAIPKFRSASENEYFAAH